MTKQELAQSLAATPDVGTVRHLAYASYITPIERRTKSGQKIETPYMSVDGRLVMANDDHRNQGAKLDIRPAIVLVNDERELTLAVTVASAVYGERTGTATSYRSGGGIEAQHPWEIAETSAIGRALACYGYGLLPGSGLASAEDMERALGVTHSSPSPDQQGGASDDRPVASRKWTPADENRFKALAMGTKHMALNKADLARLLPELADGTTLSELGSVDDVLALLSERLAAELSKAGDAA